MRAWLVLAAFATALTVSGTAVALVTSAPALGVHWTSEHASSTHPPDSALAVGPTDLIEATNAGVSRFKKRGRQEGHTESIADFLRAATWPGSSASRYLKSKCCVDPHAMWDGALQRFWFSTQQGPAGGTAYVFVALSNSSSAAGGWTVLALDQTINSNHVKEPNWCDYDQIGFNEKTLFVSCDMEPDTSPGSDTGPSGTAFARVRVISKSEFEHPRCGTEPCSWWDLEHPLDENGQPSLPITPARMYNTGTGYEYLLDASHSGDEVTVRRISDAGLCCDGNPSTRPTVRKWYISVPSFSRAPDGVQKGTGKRLDLGAPWIHSAFYDNGWLYGAQTVSCLDSYSCVQIDAFPLNGAAEPVQPDNPVLRFGTPKFFDAYPAIAPSASGRMTVVYSQTGATEFPSVLYSKILPATRGSGPSRAGTATLQRGTTSYVHTDVLHHTTTVGDYFSAAIDPDFQHVWIRGNLGPTARGTDWTSVIGKTRP